jgi:hypothetical protein
MRFHGERGAATDRFEADRRRICPGRQLRVVAVIDLAVFGSIGE